MPNFEIEGYQIGFYMADVQNGEPIHVHVRRGGQDAKFWLEFPPREAYNRGYKRSELKQIRSLIEDNRQTIVDLWNDAKGKIK